MKEQELCPWLMRTDVQPMPTGCVMCVKMCPLSIQVCNVMNLVITSAILKVYMGNVPAYMEISNPSPKYMRLQNDY